MRFAVVGVFAAVAACDPGRSELVPQPCGLTRTQPIVKLEPQVGFRLDADAGGPRSCSPSAKTSCGPCVGDVVIVPQGEQTTLAIVVENPSALTLTFVDIALQQGADPAFVLLAPLPTSVDPDAEAEVFVGVTPTSTDEIEAAVLVLTDAGNQVDPFAVTLRVAGAP